MTSGRPSFASGARDSIVRRHGQLEAPAEAGPGDRGDDRLRARLHQIDEPAQGRIRRARRRAELPDVGAAGEETAGPGEDDGPDVGVGLSPLEGRGYARTDGVRQAVDGWVGEGDDRDGAIDSVIDLRH